MKLLVEESASTVLLRPHGLGNTAMTICRLRSDQGLAEPRVMAVDASVSVIVQLQPFARHRLWHGRRMVYDGGYVAGSTSIVNMADEITCHHLSSFDNVRFQFSQRSFERLCEREERGRVTGLEYKHGMDDPVLHHLALALLLQLESNSALTPFFLDHVALAVQSHVAGSYGIWKAAATAGYLSQAQEKRAKEYIENHLDGQVSLHQLAAECALSAGHFARLFRRTTGFSPHQWLVQRRLAKASDLLAHTALPLAQIAMACGFADQSHFTNAFRRQMGVPPGSWRQVRQA